jgi:GDP-4-dehydro-6-deoxy-D-mannose reductase
MILVTGATGFAGSHLLERLPAGSRVVAWGRRTVDLLDRQAVSREIARARPTVVYHLAGAPHVGSSFEDPAAPLTINALGTHHLLSAVRNDAPDARVVVVSSAMIYAPSRSPHTEDSPAIPSSPYGLSKLAQDRLALLAARDGLNAVVARPFNHTGARQTPSFAVSAFAQQIARIEAGRGEPVLRVGNLDAERDITDVRDVVDAYKLLAADGETGVPYNVCSGRAWRIGDLLDKLLQRARVKVRVEIDPARLRPNELPRLVGDNSRLCALGWTPSIPIESTLDDVLQYWRGQHS